MMFSFFFEVLKLAVAGIAVVCVAFYLVKPFLENNEKLQLIDLKKSTSAQTLPLRLQAYERMVLLIDRINPANLLLRLNASACSASELHSLIITEVRSEFQHNVTQQLYISQRAWQVVSRLKDDTLTLANNIAKMLPDGSGGLELGKGMLTHLGTLEHDPYTAAISLIRADLEELF